MTAFLVLKAIHLLCVVAWVGGMAFAYLVLRPSLVVLEPAQRMLVHTAVFGRFFRIVWHVMPLSIFTGLAMILIFQGGMRFVSPRVHAMMGLGLIMSAVYLYIYFGPYKRFRRTTDKASMLSSLDSIRKMIGVNLILGIVTIVIGVVS